MKLSKKIFVALATVMMVLTGCNNTNNSSTPGSHDYGSLTPSDVNTEQTDKLKLNRSFEGKNFVNDGIGQVTFRSHTDGDTSNFTCDMGNDVYEKIKLRYLGINTPESTAKMEPWGLAASEFTKEKTSKAKLLVLENDVELYGQKDNNGTRYLGFVWYSMDGDPANLRLLNLELVELGYSLNQIQEKSTVCPYYDYFVAAENHARACGVKIYGEKDPNFDYSNDVVEISIRELRKNYQNYGKITSDDIEDDPSLTLSSGKQLRMTGLVVGMIGDNMILRDVRRGEEYEDDEQLDGIYCYAGYNTSLAGSVSVGDVVRFYCRAGKFNGTMQLSDLKTSFTDRKKPFQILAEDLTEPTEEYPDIDINPYVMDTSTFNTANVNGTRYGDFKAFEGKFVKTRVTVRNIEMGEYDPDGNIISGTEATGYYKEDSNGNYTCYANSLASFNAGSYGTTYLTLNIRVDGTQYPRINPTFFQVGHTYECYGYLSPYFDKYQLMLLNNTNENYVVDVTNK